MTNLFHNRQSGDDHKDWSRTAGSTPSGNTGPQGDHTSGKGNIPAHF